MYIPVTSFNELDTASLFTSGGKKLLLVRGEAVVEKSVEASGVADATGNQNPNSRT
jgi:hypothetical protein